MTFCSGDFLLSSPFACFFTIHTAGGVRSCGSCPVLSSTRLPIFWALLIYLESDNLYGVNVSLLFTTSDRSDLGHMLLQSEWTHGELNYKTCGVSFLEKLDLGQAVHSTGEAER